MIVSPLTISSGGINAGMDMYQLITPIHRAIFDPVSVNYSMTRYPREIYRDTLEENTLALARPIEEAYFNFIRVIFPETVVELPVGANAVTVEALDYRGTVDPDYICPISGQIMTTPYSHPTQSGTFEKDFIEKSLKYKRQNPLTRQPMAFTDLKLDEKKQSEINCFVKDLSTWLPKQREVNEQIPSATLKPIRFSQTHHREEPTHTETPTIKQGFTA